MSLTEKYNIEIPSEFFRQYLISKTHPVGRYKAEVIKKIIQSGLDEQQLNTAINYIADHGTVLHEIDHGRFIIFVVDGPLHGTKHSIRTAWIKLENMNKVVLINIALPETDFGRKRNGFEAFDTVVLVRDINKGSLKRGDIGVVLFHHPDTNLYEVEFIRNDGTTFAFETLKASDIKQFRDLKGVLSIRED